jgi:hypothetical protein
MVSNPRLIAMASASLGTSSARRGAALAAAGLAPFVVGRALYDANPADIGGPAITCPFRAATGLPCPLCGSTRAVALFAHGDGAWTAYNAVAVVVLLAMVVAGVVLAVRSRPLPRIRSPLAATAALLAVAWVWTLTHQDTIVP